MTKEKMEAAVRKGQGVTAGGIELQPLTIECMGPGGVAIIV